MAYQGLWNLDFNQGLRNTNTSTTGNGNPMTPGSTYTNRVGTSGTVDQYGIPRYNVNAFNPAAGQWGDYQTPIGDGFWGTRNGTNYVNGHVFAAEGLDQGGIGFNNWLARYRPMWEAQQNGTFTAPPSIGNGDPGFSRPEGTSGLGRGTGIPYLGRNLSNINPPSYGPGRPGGLDELFPQTPNGPTTPLVTPISTNIRTGNQMKGGLATFDPITNNGQTPQNPPTNNPLATRNGQGNREYQTGPDGRTPGAEREYDTLLNGRDPYGTVSQYYGRNNQNWLNDPNADLSGMPEWLRNQYRWNDREGSWELNNRSGVLQDQQGNRVVQIGNQSQAVGGGHSDGSVRDWSQVRYDPALGMVTSPENVRHVVSRGHQVGRAFVGTMIAAGFVYVAAGASGLLTTPSGATLTEGATAGIEAAGSAGIGTEAVGSAVANLPAGTVTSFTTAANGAWQAVVNGATYVWNNARGIWTAISAGLTINNLTGDPLGINRNTNNRNTNVNTNNNNGDFLTNLLGTGVSNYMDNRNIRQFEGRQDELLNRADYNRQYREGFLQRHANFLNDPNAMFNDPNYQAFEEDELGDLSRRFNARGMALSGNEMGGLMDHQRTLRTQYRNNELNNLRQGIGLGNPERTYGDAMRYLPFLYQARGARNFDTTRNIQDLLRNAPQAIQDLFRTISNFRNGTGTLDDIDPDLLRQFEDAAARNGQSVDQYLASDEFINNLPGMNIDFGDNSLDNWWQSLFSNNVGNGDDTDESWLDDFFGDGGP